MKRIPNNILPKFEEETGIKAKVISGYLSDKDPVKPGRNRCLILAGASKKLGYDFTEADWMFDPKKIRMVLTSPSQANNSSFEKEGRSA